MILHSSSQLRKSCLSFSLLRMHTSWPYLEILLLLIIFLLLEILLETLLLRASSNPKAFRRKISTPMEPGEETI